MQNSALSAIPRLTHEGHSLVVSLPVALQGDGLEFFALCDGVRMPIVREPARDDAPARLKIELPEAASQYLNVRRMLDVRVSRGGYASSLQGFPRLIHNPGRKPKILVLMPAGTVVGHNNVLIHDKADIERIVSDYINIGDSVVYDSCLKLIDFESFSFLYVSDPTKNDYQRYLREYDFCFLRGSNFVRNGMPWMRAVEALENIQIPVVALGVGAQAVSPEMFKLDPEQLRIWQLISERSQSLGVRGTFSEAVLRHNGIRNVDIVGCPSVFRELEPGLQLKEPPRDVERPRVAVNIRREVGPDYAVDPIRYAKMQRRLVLKADAESELIVTTHGESEEKAIYFDHPTLAPQAVAALKESGWFGQGDGGAMERIYRNQLRYFLTVREYEQTIADRDFVFGLRVHGNLPALAQGIPSTFIEYDQRSSELASTFSIPSIPLADASGLSLQEILERSDFGPFNMHFRKHYESMAAFLDRNGVTHRMWSVQPVQPGSQP